MVNVDTYSDWNDNLAKQVMVPFLMVIHMKNISQQAEKVEK